MKDATGKDQAPRLLGFLSGQPIGRVHEVRVWCRYCCAWHIHGVQPWAEAGTTAYRLAHCFSPTSPYKESGYWIEVAYAHFDEVERQVRSATTSQQLRIAESGSTPGIERLRRQAEPIDTRERRPAPA